MSQVYFLLLLQPASLLSSWGECDSQPKRRHNKHRREERVTHHHLNLARVQVEITVHPHTPSSRINKNAQTGSGHHSTTRLNNASHESKEGERVHRRVQGQVGSLGRSLPPGQPTSLPCPSLSRHCHCQMSPTPATMPGLFAQSSR